MAFSNLALLLALSCFSFAIPFNSRPFDNALRERRPSLGPRAADGVLYTNSSSELQVDLGYEIYQGLYNSTIGLNTWLGIRYAAPPIGALRWQAPQVPTSNRSSVIQAQSVPNQCPQSADNSGNLTAAVLGSSTAGGSEDCLFLNVYAPQNAENLPVLVWIHGGGYGQGNGNLNFTPIIKANNDGFIGVAIQYRLGAFGFLSSDEVNRFGVPNAGIRDQTFALQWVQSYISLFGGNASQVTISGESAGGGSVMLQTMAFGGNLGTSLFGNAITASPYLPMQYNYNDWVPSQSYYAFAQAAGCFSGYAEGSLAIGASIFQCLVATDTETLKNASAAISASGSWGTWGFLPVTDGSFIQDIPSQQLTKKQVNGIRMLTGNNADEGAEFVPGNITTEADLVNYLQETFPLFTEDDISKILLYYPSSNATDDPNAALYATTGESGPTAINQSSVATGQQQRADSIYGETTFVCPSYWLAEAFTSKDRASYKYQYSIPPALHGSDASAYFGPAQDTQGPSFVRAFMTIWGNFIISNNPSISSSIAQGNASSDAGDGGIVNWPAYNNLSPMMVNLNQTGGVPDSADSGIVDLDTGNPINTTIYVEPGLQNKFDVVDAWSWEGGRGVRCDFWKSMGVLVPE